MECTMKKNRLFDVLAMGPELIDEAKRNGISINESYLLVHRVLSQALKEDLARIPKERLRDHLASQLKNLAAA
jgi:type III secretion system FlhB-like substrate exporter